MREGEVAQEAMGDLRKGIELQWSTIALQWDVPRRVLRKPDAFPGQVLDAKPEAKRGMGP
jgi:hypothetical protein